MNNDLLRKVSVTNAEGPPVPIPNTEVKLCSGENTLRETVRENSSMLTSTKEAKSFLCWNAKCEMQNAKWRKQSLKEFLIPNSWFRIPNLIWGCSSAGRAPALQAGGHGFESHHLHQGNVRSFECRWNWSGIRSRSGSEWQLITVRAANDWARSSRESRIPSSPPGKPKACNAKCEMQNAKLSSSVKRITH